METPPHRAGRTAGAATGVLAGAVIVLGLAAPLVIAAHYDAFGIPRSDDWSYLLTEFRWIGGGRLSFNHWVSMSLVGQLALAAPIAGLFPRDIRALQVFTAVLGTVGLLAVYGTARLAGLRRAMAALVALTIAAGPLWGPLAVSFMTDVPAFALSAIATYLATRALVRRPPALGLLWAAVAAGLIACTIRQYAAVTVAAVLAAGWIATREDRRARREIVVAALVSFVAIAAFLLWWQSIPDNRSLSPTLTNAHAINVLFSKGAGFVRLAGLTLLPVVVACRPFARLRAAWRSERLATIVVAVGVVVWLGATTGRVAADVFVGNYVVHDGALSDIVLIGPRVDVLPHAVWRTLLVVVSLAGAVLVVLAAHAAIGAARRWRVPRPDRDPVTVLLGAIVVGYLGTYVAAVLTGVQVYDRYLLPVLAPAAILLLRSRVPATAGGDAGARSGWPRAVATIAAFAVLAFVGLAFTADSASFDGARWHAAELAVARGWPARTVNGGFEWRNYHRGYKLAPGQVVPGAKICVTVRVDPHVARRRVVAVVTSSAPTRRTMRLVAFRTTTASCRRTRR